MPARSPGVFLISLLLASACTGAVPTATVSPTAAPTSAPTANPEPTAAATSSSATPRPTPATATAAPSPNVTAAPTATPFAGPVVNPDGSVWISQGAGGFVMTGDDAIWAIFDNGSTRDVVRIDPETNEMETVITVPTLPNPITAVGVGDFVWVASWDRSSVTQYDEQTGEEIDEHLVGTHPVEPIYAYGDIWTTAIHGNTVGRIDPETADVQLLEMEPSGEPIGMTAVRDDRALIGNAGKAPYVIDPQTMTVVGIFDPHVLSGCSPRIGAIEGELWMDNCTLDDPLVILDLDTGETLGQVDSPVTVDAPLFVDDLMWMPREINNEHGHSDGQNWVGIDHDTHELVAEYAAASKFTEAGYAVGFDSLWMFGLEGILRIPADTLREAVDQ